VTSNPSRDYLYRVVQKFNDNGQGVRGDLPAVIAAILLDVEARGANATVAPTFGKQREPVLRVTALARAFAAPPTMNGNYLESGTETNLITMPGAHRLNNGDTVQLLFTDTSGNPAPANQGYKATVRSANTFTVVVPNVLAGTYYQNTNVITVTNSGHGLRVGNPVYLKFTSGAALSGQYTVSTVPSSTVFTVATADSTLQRGNCLEAKISASGFSQVKTNVTVSCSGPHGLNPGDSFYADFGTTKPGDGVYQVDTVPDATHFTLLVTNSATQTSSGFNLFPLVPPPLSRAGNVTIQWNTWNLGATDSGSTFNLSQSPLSSPTVFNFFFPNYQFPGALASAGLTTPEFQLTSDTSVALQMNYLEGGILAGSNTNGLSSFNNNGGAVFLDIGPWVSTNWTSSANLPKLVDSMNSLLAAGQLSAAARSNIVNYVTNNITFSTPPTPTQIRDRARAVVHLITASPDFTIQK